MPGAIRVRLLVPDGLHSKRLPPDDYDVQIGMIRESYAWFPNGGHSLAWLTAKVSL